jgi:hypothetical protein
MLLVALSNRKRLQDKENGEQFDMQKAVSF